MTRLVGYPRMVCIVSLMGVRRFLGVFLDGLVGVDWVVKVGQNWVLTFILSFILLVNGGLETRMNA